MRTARALTASPSMLCAGGCSTPGGVSALGGCVSAPGGCLLPGGVCLGGCLLLGVSAPGGVPGQVTPPPPVDRHMPVNILSCPKLRMRAVIRCVGLRRH